MSNQFPVQLTADQFAKLRFVPGDTAIIEYGEPSCTAFVDKIEQLPTGGVVLICTRMPSDAAWTIRKGMRPQATVEVNVGGVQLQTSELHLPPPALDPGTKVEELE